MFEPGSQIGRYEIQRRIGRGGMGTVYVAHDPVLGRMVAIKVFAGDLDVPQAGERFAREARAAAALNHPNIVTVFDFGEYDSQAFIVMEYVPGETLAAMVRRKAPVTVADRLRWVEELCAGVGYAHAMHVIHRDIKPANLMIDRGGHLKVLDFGVARMMSVTSNTSVMVGTPGYMAPEQITGEPVDQRADQFSVGVVLYELLAYREAFSGDTLPMITNRILTEEPVPLDRLVPDLAPELVAVVTRAMHKRPDGRFGNLEALRYELAHVRRRIAPDDEASAPTIVAGPLTPPPGYGSRGTGSSGMRRPSGSGVGQMTPAPDGRRTGREALAQRRTVQLESALEEARRLLARGELDAALDQCYQALTFDEAHAGAQQLEAEIVAAIQLRDGTLADSLPTAAVVPSAAGIRSIAPEGRVSAVVGTTLGVPAEADAAEAPAVPPAGAAGDTLPTLSWLRAAVAGQVRRHPRRVAGVAAGALALAALVVIVLLSLPAPTGRVVIDAAPWGTITAITSEGGDARAVPEEAATPLRLSLPAGFYDVTIVGPPPESREERVGVTVEADGDVVAPLVRFETMTPEAYFGPYLTLGGPAAAGAEAPADTPAPGAGEPPTDGEAGTR
jgi:serine/threonine-protein kinase